MRIKKINEGYFRNGVFGAEDSLVSTVGVLFGVSTAVQDKTTVLLTGIIVIAVEALSMGAGAFSTETSTQEIKDTAKPKEKPWIDGLIMFLSYFITGILVLSPYLFLDLSTGKIVSVAIAVIALFLLGYLPNKKLKSGLRTVMVAGLAIIVGYLIGQLHNGSQP